MIKRQIEDEDAPVNSWVKTVFLALLSGVGLGIGFFLVDKALKQKK